MKKHYLAMLLLMFLALGASAQFPRFQRQQKLDPVIQKMSDEETNNSQLKTLAHQLFDEIGPRLVGTPKMQQANDWAVAKYKSWDIDARNEKWGEWRGWERGITHIDMIAPWIKTLEGTQLAWSPSTNGKTVTGEAIIFPDLQDSVAYINWLPNVKGKFVMISMEQPTGRSDANWKEFGTENSIAKMNHERDSLSRAWNKPRFCNRVNYASLSYFAKHIWNMNTAMKW